MRQSICYNTTIARLGFRRYAQSVSSYLFTSRRDPLLCVITPDSTGGALPAEWGPWDRTEAPWDGQDANLVAGVREMLEEREGDLPDDDGGPPTRH